QHHYAFDLVYVPEINKGNLRKRFDLLIFVGGAIPPLSDGAAPAKEREKEDDKEKEAPEGYKEKWGKITADTSIVALKRFIQDGGKIVTFGRSANLAYHLKIGVTNALVENIKGKQVPLNASKFYIPGSLLRARVDTTSTVGWGMASSADFFFDSSPVFRISPEAAGEGKVKPVVWFDSAAPLRSGWAYGQEYLQDGVAAFHARFGAGELYCFGPEITFRAQTYGTYKLLFNLLYSGY
ncbi:MAG: peptidase, partial [Marinilabiliales bacterium]|nr:peptidase [Marinilabiliales bacterium]